MTDRWLSVSIAARRLDVCGETIRRWVKAGKIPAIRYPGGHYKISAAAIEKILSPSSTSPTATS